MDLDDDVDDWPWLKSAVTNLLIIYSSKFPTVVGTTDVCIYVHQMMKIATLSCPPCTAPRLTYIKLSVIIFFLPSKLFQPCAELTNIVPESILISALFLDRYLTAPLLTQLWWRSQLNPVYNFKMGICKPGPVLDFVKGHSWEQFLTQICASKKRHYSTENFQKLWEWWRHFRNFPVMSTFPYASLNLLFSSLLLCKVPFATQSGHSTSDEKGSANIWKVSRCAVKSAKHSFNFSIAECIYQDWMLCPFPPEIRIQWNDRGVFFCSQVSFPQSQFCVEGFHTLISCCDELTWAMQLQVKDVELYVH